MITCESDYWKCRDCIGDACPARTMMRGRDCLEPVTESVGDVSEKVGEGRRGCRGMVITTVEKVNVGV